jgi:hypothetical protein
MTPFDIAFEPLTFKYKNWLAFNIFIDVIFVVDIVLNFRTTKSDVITEDEITNSKEIAINYLKGRFIIDLISAIPMDIILAGNKLLDVDYMDNGHSSSSSAPHRILGETAAGASAT